MKVNDLTILAIAPGTREIGWAILQAGSLLHCGVRTITKRHLVEIAKIESNRFIESLIVRYEPCCLAIEKRRLVQKSSSVLAVIGKGAKAISQKKGLKVSEYISTIVRKRLCEKEAPTKKNVSQILAKRYPELENYLKHENRWAELYYSKMFDAVAVGVVYHQDLMKA